MSGSDSAPDQAPAGQLDDEQLVRHAVAAARPDRLWVEVVSPRPVPEVRARRLAMYHRPNEVDGLEMRFRRRIDGVLVSASDPCAPTSTADIDDAIGAYMSIRAEELDLEYWVNTDVDRDFGDPVYWWELLDDPHNASPEEVAETKAEAAISNGVPPPRSTVPEPSGDDRSPAAPPASDRDGKRTDRDHSPARVDPDRTERGRANGLGDGVGRRGGSGVMPAGSPPRWRIDDVLSRTRLDEVLDDLAGAAERSGPGRKWHCPAPDHDDHRASVTMHTDRRGHERWRCWSGDHRGDAIDLVVLRNGGTRLDAVDWLATRAGMIPDRPLPPIPHKPRPAPHATTMDPAVERYVRICAAVLWGPQGRPVRDWLHGRGFDEATMRANLLGCDPGRQLMRRQRGLPYGNVPAATFPAFGPTGQVTFVQARYLDVDAAGRKYDNPAAALAPNPRITFAASPTPPRWPVLLVCEGMPDALTAAQAGYRAVGLLGAHAPNHTVAARVASYAEQHHLAVVVMCDANEPGRAAGDHLGELLAAERVEPILVEPPADLADPDGAPVVDLNAWAQLDPDWSTDLNTALGATITLEPDVDHSRAQVERSGLGIDD